MANLREDPYFVVRDDVNDSLEKADKLLRKYQQRQAENAGESELAELAKELKNSIRSMEWDLEDLSETVGIVERTPAKFKLTMAEVETRKRFISDVKLKLKRFKEEMNGDRKRNTEKQSLLTGTKQGTYSSSLADSNRQFVDDTMQQQQLLIRAQDDQIDNIGASVKVLKNISSHIGNELEEQAVLLDDFGHDMDKTHNRMDETMKKIAKVTKMSSDKRQCCAIGILIVIVIILVILISVL